MDSVENQETTAMQVESKEEEINKIPPNENNAIIVNNSSALELLAQYTDSDEDESDKLDVNLPENYRTKDSSSSSSSSSDSEDEIDINQIKKKLETPISDDDSDEEGGKKEFKKKKDPLRVKGELLLEDLPPIQDLQIQVDERECLELGTITSVVEQLVLVEAYPHSAPLDIDSVLFLDHGKQALGKIFDVIGPVSMPIYCIRFNSNDEILSKGIAIGAKVFCAPRTEYTSFVILSNVMACKGSDASWKNDIEPPDNLVDYSDDEQEKSAKRQNRPNKNTNINNGSNTNNINNGSNANNSNNGSNANNHNNGNNINNTNRPTMQPRRRFPQQNYSWHNNFHHQQQQQPHNYFPMLPPPPQNYPYNQ